MSKGTSSASDVSQMPRVKEGTSLASVNFTCPLPVGRHDSFRYPEGHLLEEVCPRRTRRVYLKTTVAILYLDLEGIAWSQRPRGCEPRLSKWAFGAPDAENSKSLHLLQYTACESSSNCRVFTFKIIKIRFRGPWSPTFAVAHLVATTTMQHTHSFPVQILHTLIGSY